MKIHFITTIISSTLLLTWFSNINADNSLASQIKAEVNQVNVQVNQVHLEQEIIATIAEQLDSEVIPKSNKIQGKNDVINQQLNQQAYDQLRQNLQAIVIDAKDDINQKISDYRKSILPDVDDNAKVVLPIFDPIKTLRTEIVADSNILKYF
jgi:predicted sulfurtransferase